MPGSEPIEDLDDSQSGEESDDRKVIETEFPDSNAFSSGDEDQPYLQPWAQGMCQTSLKTLFNPRSLTGQSPKHN